MCSCKILQNKWGKKIFLDLSPMILAAVDAPTMMERFGAMKDILDSTYSYILCLDWFSSRAMSHASSSCFSSSSLSMELKPQNHRTSTYWQAYKRQPWSTAVKTDQQIDRLKSAHPCVVEAVTLTTMMVALVRICCRVSLFLHFSRLFPNSWAGNTHEA